MRCPISQSLYVSLSFILHLVYSVSCKLPLRWSQLAVLLIRFTHVPSHLLSISANPAGQSEQLYPRPRATSSCGVKSVQFLPRGQGLWVQAFASFSQSSPEKYYMSFSDFLFHWVWFFIITMITCFFYCSDYHRIQCSTHNWPS